MKIKIASLVLLLIVSILSVHADKNDLKKANLKGNITSVQTTPYTCEIRFGEYIKNKELDNENNNGGTVYYNDRGNILRKKSVEKPDQAYSEDEKVSYIYKYSYDSLNRLLNIFKVEMKSNIKPDFAPDFAPDKNFLDEMDEMKEEQYKDSLTLEEDKTKNDEEQYNNDKERYNEQYKEYLGYEKQYKEYLDREKQYKEHPTYEDTISKISYIYLPNENYIINNYKINDDKSLTLDDETKYIYINGRIKIDDYDGNGTLQGTKTIKGNLSIGQSATCKQIITMDSFGRPIKVAITFSRLSANLFNYVFNANIFKQSQSSSKMRTVVRKILYNKMGDIANETYFYNNKIKETKYVYIYDNYNNWITKKEYKDGFLVEWTDRVIVYK